MKKILCILVCLLGIISLSQANVAIVQDFGMQEEVIRYISVFTVLIGLSIIKKNWVRQEKTKYNKLKIVVIGAIVFFLLISQKLLGTMFYIPSNCISGILKIFAVVAVGYYTVYNIIEISKSPKESKYKKIQIISSLALITFSMVVMSFVDVVHDIGRTYVDVKQLPFGFIRAGLQRHQKVCIYNQISVTISILMEYISIALASIGLTILAIPSKLRKNKDME